MYKTNGVKSASQIQTLRPVVCFSHLRWDFVYQRPQHLLSRCALGCQVLFIEEPLYNDADGPSQTLATRDNGVVVATLSMPRNITASDSIDTQRKFVDDLLDQFSIDEFVAWYYTPMALRFTSHLRPAVIVYDCMDELSAFRGAPLELSEMERCLFARADIVFTGGASLYAAKRAQHRSVHLFPSSIDASHFAKARNAFETPDPGDQAPIGKPRIGFFGVLDERLDCELVQRVAERRRDWQFIFIGPVVKILPDDLPRSENIHYLGQKSYQELPAYIAGWDLAMMPFACNESTQFISPTKTPEYLAAGKPVVSTPIRDVVCAYGSVGVVQIAKDANEFVKAMDTAMAQRTKEWLESVDELLVRNSWDITWGRMWTLIEQCAMNTDLAPRKATGASSSLGQIGGTACLTI